MRKILTDAEKIFYSFLLVHLNFELRQVDKSITIFPKVRLADLIDRADIDSGGQKFFFKTAYKHVDFLICDSESCNIICAVELDDFYHSDNKRLERDKFVDEVLQNSGVTVLRVNTRVKYLSQSSIYKVITFVMNYYSPICPKCGGMCRYDHNKTLKSEGAVYVCRNCFNKILFTGE